MRAPVPVRISGVPDERLEPAVSIADFTWYERERPQAAADPAQSELPGVTSTGQACEAGGSLPVRPSILRLEPLPHSWVSCGATVRLITVGQFACLFASTSEPTQH